VRKTLLPGPVSVDNVMILLLISNISRCGSDRRSKSLAPTIPTAKSSCRRRHDATKMTDYRFARVRRPVRIERGKIFHFSICHLAHVRVICDCF
jgi:hypothetical protein